MTLGERLRTGASRLAAAGIESPRREARLLLAHATGLDTAALVSDAARDPLADGYDEMVARRAAREPLAFILGHQPFWTLDLLVSPDTLIPRADSESLVEAALRAFPGRDVQRVLDLGTGSGCLLLAAMTEFPGAFGVGVDRAERAVLLARRNAARTGLDHRTAWVCADWGAALDAQFDLVLCNPPYIETAAIAGLMPEVSRHEPLAALDGGSDGLSAYRAIIAMMPGLLSADGVAILELGVGQAPRVSALVQSAGLVSGVPGRDLSGIERALPLGRSNKKTFGEAVGGR